MAVLIQILNGKNQCRDFGFQAENSLILKEGVRKGYMNELAVTLNSVATGMCFIRVTRKSVTPNEVFNVPVWITSPVTVSTSGTGWIIVKIDQNKINDGSNNSADGSGVATIENVNALPVNDPYLILATLNNGAITDARTWAGIAEEAIENPIYYDEDLGNTDSYAVTIAGVKKYIDGQLYVFKAHTTNVGAATFSINNLPPKSLRKNHSSVLADGDIVANQIVGARYNADTDFMEMESHVGNSPFALSKATVQEAQLGVEQNNYMTPATTLETIEAWGYSIKGTLGEAVSQNDINTLNNLVGLNTADGKWYKVTSTIATWYRKLGLVRKAGVLNDSVDIMRRGIYSVSALNIPATIAPTIDYNFTGASFSVGQVGGGVTDAAVPFNNNGAEYVLAGATIRVKHSGATPPGALRISVVLPSGDQGGYVGGNATSEPACFKDVGNSRLRGAVMGEATIAAANFSGNYQDFTVTFTPLISSTIKIPAGGSFWIVYSMDGLPINNNYYIIEAGNPNIQPGYMRTLNAIGSQQAAAWSTVNNKLPKITLIVTPVSTTGYTLKVYTGSNGSFGLTPSNNWSPPIGRLLSPSLLFFDPDAKENEQRVAKWTLQAESAFSGGVSVVDFGFCPKRILFESAHYLVAANNCTTIVKGYMDANSKDALQMWGSDSINVGVIGYISRNGGNFAVSAQHTSWLPVAGQSSNMADPSGVDGLYRIMPNAAQQSYNDKNTLYCLRLENGCYLYNGYPAVVSGTSKHQFNLIAN